MEYFPSRGKNTNTFGSAATNKQSIDMVNGLSFKDEIQISSNQVFSLQGNSNQVTNIQSSK